MKTNSRPGFMIVEILVALALAGLLVITVVSVLAASRRLQNEGKLRQQALDYAREAVEIISDIQQAQFTKTGASACTPMPGYTTCWTDAFGNASTKLKLIYSGSAWELQEIIGGNCFQINTNPSFYRAITIENQGTTRPNDVKKVTIDVYWPTCESSKKVSLDTILTAWKN